MRILSRIVIHYTATPPDMDIGVTRVREWHLARGFSDVGYHYVVRLDGTVEKGRDLARPGAHAHGHNHDSVGICYVGGGTGQDTRTPAQKNSITDLITAVRLLFGEHIKVYGHRELAGAATLCPGFDASKEYNG